MAERNPRDVQVGANLARMRGEMSQQALATAMRERGWRWSQATVWAIESGERPLRITEAADVSSILFPNRMSMIHDLVREPEGLSLSLWIGEASRRWHELVDAIYAFREAQFQVWAGVDQARESGARMSTVEAEGGGWLDKEILEQAMREAQERWTERGPVGGVVPDGPNFSEVFSTTREDPDGEHPEA